VPVDNDADFVDPSDMACAIQKQTSRREMLRYSVTLAGSALLVHLFPARLLLASEAGDAQQAPSAADLLASMRAKFNAVPMETQKLADNVTMFDANVIQMGDTFFNGMYPYIDPGTGGKITGMIAAADKILSLADNDTKIVAGHGPLGNKADLTKSRDMLITSRDRIQKLKSAGKSALEAVAEKPLADLDPVWGKGIVNSDQFVQVVFLTL
jgi:hypothetical protein